MKKQLETFIWGERGGKSKIKSLSKFGIRKNFNKGGATMKQRDLIATLVLFVLFFTLYTSSTYAQKEKDPYKVGVIFTVAGRYAALGLPQKEGAFLAAEAINKDGGINGHRLELIFEDDGGDPSVASRLAKKMISEDKVVALSGGTPIASAHAMALVGEQMKIPSMLISPQSSVVEGKKSAFIEPPRVEISSLADTKYILEKLKWRRVAILHDTTEFGIFMSNMGEKALKGYGVDVLKEQFLSTDTDLTSLLIKVKSWKPEGIYLIGSIPSAPAILMKNLKDLAMDVPVTGACALTTGKFLELVGKAGEGMHLQSYLKYGDHSPEQKYFFDMMARKYPGVQPNMMHGETWDAIRILAHVMKKVGNNPQKIRDGLETLRGYQGVIGEYNYSPEDHNGHTVRSITMVQVKEGKFVHLYSFEK
jgi:branched-chain amino acid transport system substrate-binding protein